MIALCINLISSESDTKFKHFAQQKTSLFSLMTTFTSLAVLSSFDNEDKVFKSGYRLWSLKFNRKTQINWIILKSHIVNPCSDIDLLRSWYFDIRTRINDIRDVIFVCHWYRLTTIVNKLWKQPYTLTGLFSIKLARLVFPHFL